MKKSGRYKKAKAALIFWTLFIGLGAVLGAVCMIIDPSGKILQMDKMLPYFEKLPLSEVLFQDYLFSGFALLTVNGITNIISFILLLKNKKSGIILGGVFGITLMLWICIQFYMFPVNAPDILYFIFGLLQAVTGYVSYVFYKQENYKTDYTSYTNIGTDKEVLVVFFSRMGYTKKVAYAIANDVGADIYEIKTDEKTDGTAGFWWCGRFAMHRWPMKINKTDLNPEEYKHVIICSPIWVFSLSSPIRQFAIEAKGRIKSVEYVFVHYMNHYFKNPAKEMNSILGLKASRVTDICCHMGYIKKERQYENNKIGETHEVLR